MNSFGFASITHFSSASQWHGFTVCFWAKSSLSAGEKIPYLSYYDSTGDVVLRIVYKERNDQLTFTGWKSTTYEKNVL